MIERLAVLRYVVVSTAITLVAFVVLISTHHRVAGKVAEVAYCRQDVVMSSAAYVDVVPSYVPSDVYR